jgi:hypothetical protein
MKPQRTPFALCLIYFLMLVSCQPEKNLDEFQFLIGKWEGKRDEMTLQELWKNEDGAFLSGEGVVVAGTDTLFHEKVKLEIREGDVFYIATLPNNKEPVAFKLVSSETNRWSFENKEHDFPQEITYHLIKPDSLHATISGNDKGKPSKEEFYFKKIN